MLAAVEWSRGVEDAWTNVAAFVPKFAAFLLVLVVGIFVAKALARAADKVLERVGFEEGWSAAG